MSGFGIGRSLKKVARVAAPFAALAVPGIGPALGAGLGLSGATASLVGGGLLGGGLAALSGGGLPGIISGGLTGGLGSALAGGGLLGKGGLLGGGLLGKGGLGSALGDTFGNVAGSTLDTVTGTAGLQGPTLGSGLLGKVTSFMPTHGAAQPMRLGSLLGAAGDIYGYMQSERDMDKLERLMQQQSQSAQQQLQPYSQAGQAALQRMQMPSMEALRADPGYQFRLGEGQRAVERSMAARGLGQSGAALRAAQEYGQNLADQTYRDFFNRQAMMAGQGMNAAGGLGSLMTNLGNAQAQAEMERIKRRNEMISSLTRNSMFGGGGPGGLLGGVFS